MDSNYTCLPADTKPFHHKIGNEANDLLERYFATNMVVVENYLLCECIVEERS